MVNKVEINILADLYRANRFVSVTQLAMRLGYSWITINKYVWRLKKKGVVITDKTPRRTYVAIDPEYRARLNKKRRYY
jgi:biotin operon repressor